MFRFWRPSHFQGQPGCENVNLDVLVLCFLLFFFSKKHVFFFI